MKQTYLIYVIVVMTITRSLESSYRHQELSLLLRVSLYNTTMSLHIVMSSIFALNHKDVEIALGK